MFHNSIKIKENFNFINVICTNINSLFTEWEFFSLVLNAIIFYMYLKVLSILIKNITEYQIMVKRCAFSYPINVIKKKKRSATFSLIRIYEYLK